jgi:hypothetical protein
VLMPTMPACCILLDVTSVGVGSTASTGIFIYLTTTLLHASRKDRSTLAAGLTGFAVIRAHCGR